MYCRKCGSELLDGARFCAKCGEPVRISEEQTPKTDESAAPVEPNESAATTELDDFATTEIDGSAATAKIDNPAIVSHAGVVKRTHTKQVTAGVFIVLLLAIVVAVVWFTQFSPIKINENTFPDDALRSTISEQFDTDGDGKLSREEAKAVTVLTVDGAQSIDSLARIFPNLKTLTLAGDSLVSVDVSNMTELTSLEIESSALTSLNVSGASSLVSLNVSDSVSDSVEISGLDDTQLVEVWLPVQLSDIDNGEEVYRTEIERDSSGRILSITEGEYSNGSYGTSDSNSTPYYVTTEYSYDESGRLSSYVSITEYLSDIEFYGQTECTTELSYDNEGNLVKTSSDSAGGYGNYEYSYDENGNLISGGSFTYEWDDADNLTAVYLWNGLYYIYTYDDQGRVTGMDIPDNESSDERVANTISYDDEGNIVSVAPTSADEAGSPSVTYSYDDEGRLSSAEASDAKSYQSANAQVEYDDNGNAKSITFECVYYGSSYTSGCDITYSRYFVTEDEAASADPCVVVSPDCNSLASEGTLIQAYVLKPETALASYSLPVSLDWQYRSQPTER